LKKKTIFNKIFEYTNIVELIKLEIHESVKPFELVS